MVLIGFSINVIKFEFCRMTFLLMTPVVLFRRQLSSNEITSLDADVLHGLSNLTLMCAINDELTNEQNNVQCLNVIE